MKLHAVAPALPPTESFTHRHVDGCISTFSALLQIPRIARARGIPVPTLHALVADNTTARHVGARRESRVNVHALNAALEAWNTRRDRFKSPRGR
jgi:K+-transporting ATPase ATPase C chain